MHQVAFMMNLPLFLFITKKLQPPGRFLKKSKEGFFEEFIPTRALCKIAKDLRSSAFEAMNSGTHDKLANTVNIEKVDESVEVVPVVACPVLNQRSSYNLQSLLIKLHNLMD